MATVGIALSAVSNNARSGLNAVVPAVDAVPYGAAVLTSSAASQTFGVTAPADADGMFWVISAQGGNVWAAFGPTPTAVAGTHYLVIGGAPPLMLAASGNQKCAVIDA